MPVILIIDDNIDICLILSTYLRKQQFQTDEAYTGKSALQLLKQKKFDLIFCDYRLPDYDGLALLQQIRTMDPDAGVIMMTAYADVKIAIECLRMGALDYITKPIHHQEMIMLVKDFLKRKEEKNEVKRVASSAPVTLTANSKYVWGQSEKSLLLVKNIGLIAPTDMTVIIHGESGTGKEYVARAIHDHSPRRSMPFVALDCGSLSEELASSEMFGHIRGSFTGAIQDKTGQFEYAKGGTLFLDEIGNLSYENQIKLLRVLQEHKIRKVGGNNDIEIDVRVIVASNENLKDAAAAKKFREDLYHRLNEFIITVEPLRQRREDIQLYIKHFLKEANVTLGKNIKEIDAVTYEKLVTYYWHGNLRELKNVIKRAVLLSTSETISMECIPDEIIFSNNKNSNFIEDMPVNLLTLARVTSEAEKEAITHVLSRTANNRTKAAEVLNIDRKTLYNKMKLYGIANG